MIGTVSSILSTGRTSKSSYSVEPYRSVLMLSFIIRTR